MTRLIKIQIMKKLPLLIFFLCLVFSSSLYAQSNWENSYFFTRIGTYSFNEINIGYGFAKTDMFNLELMFGIDYGSDYWREKCGVFGFFGWEQFRARTALKGVNIRPTVYFNKRRSIGLTGIFRYALAKDFWVSTNCHNSFDENRFYSDYKAFDYGVMFTINLLNSKRISILLSPGYKQRFYNRTQTEVNSQFSQNLEPVMERSNRGFLICDFAIQVKFAQKKD